MAVIDEDFRELPTYRSPVRAKDNISVSVAAGAIYLPEKAALKASLYAVALGALSVYDDGPSPEGPEERTFTFVNLDPASVGLGAEVSGPGDQEWTVTRAEILNGLEVTYGPLVRVTFRRGPDRLPF